MSPSTPSPIESSIQDGLPSDPAESLDLAARAKCGDPTALNQLLSRYQDRLRRIVRIRLGGKLRQHVDSMDIVQETYVVASRKVEGLEVRTNAGILNWLARIAEHKIHDANDYHFAQKRNRDLERPMDAPDSVARGLADELRSPVEAPEERVWRRELREIVDDALCELSDEHREVILARDYCGGEWDFVATHLGSPSVHAAQEMHRRAWIRLRRLVHPRLRGLLG